MFSHLKIGSRLLILIVAFLATLILTSTIALRGLSFANEATEQFNQKLLIQTHLQTVADTVRTDILGTITALNLGAITWASGRKGLDSARTNFMSNWDTFKDDLAENDDALISIEPDLSLLLDSLRQMENLALSENRANLSLFSINDLEPGVSPFLNSLAELIQRRQTDAAQTYVKISSSGNRYFTITLIIVIAGIIISLLLGFLIYRSITAPIAIISKTVRAVSEGDFTVRTKILGKDELGQLGETFDTMLNDRVSTLSAMEAENDQLNISVVELLQAVSHLSLEKDLTIKVPVSEDVIGPVADSLNLLTSEVIGVLRGVTDISDNVSNTSLLVKEQSDTVLSVAKIENIEVGKTAEELNKASDAMAQIAAMAQSSNETADKVATTTSTALEAVNRTVTGINNIRDSIRETEKRIKRLGERSQEITGTINLINSISERTHILALNASMHAASAGEAGRGFAVVADEVQRLAENAREATSQISTLVNNIQVETNDTVNTMNRLIQEVIEGTRLAEQAGEEMSKTQKTTNKLVASVQEINASSQIQVTMSQALLVRSKTIQESSKETSSQLAAQGKNTEQLVAASAQLIEAVRVFKLPVT